MSEEFSAPENGALSFPSEQDTMAFGATLAEVVQPGDVITLKGALGAGKTTFARGFIQRLAGIDEEVVSPTFTLVQTYETQRGIIWHFDLYRLEVPDDVLELGLEDAQAGGITLIEWPERLGPYMPRAPLEIELTSATGDTARSIRLSGKSNWRERALEVVSRVRQP